MLDFFIFCFFDLYFFFFIFSNIDDVFFPGLFVVHMHAFVISSNSPCINVFLIIYLPPPQKPPNLC